MVFGEIKETLRARYGIRVEEARPIRKGYLNEKWICRTNRGDWFVKRYAPERYRGNGEAIWAEIGHALRLQAAFEAAGGECPRLLDDGEGGYVHRTPRGERFAVMRVCPGVNVAAGEATEDQMRTLGQAAARMHAAWNDGADGGRGGSGGVPLWTPDLAELREKWLAWREQAAAAEQGEILEALALQRGVLDRIEPAELVLALGPPGWTHLDLWTENLLFHPDRLAAIVDFDRVRYSYPALDLGRALLSCALRDGELRADAVSAFAEGYRSRRPLPRGAVFHAVRHVWVIESTWWIRPAAASWSTAPRRFRQEMVWIAEQWDRLADTLGGI